MASRKGISIYIPEYFMAVENCTNIYVLCGLEVLHGYIPYICTFYVYLHNHTLRVTKRTRSQMSTVR